MKSHLLLCFFLFVSMHAFGQIDGRKVSGCLVDDVSGAGIPSVSCRAINSKGRISAHALTDENGRFTLELKNDCKSVEFCCIGYKKKNVSPCNIDRASTIRLKPETIALKEVTVRVKPIEVHKDTINYNVSAFADKNDHYLEDVLKKLPGIHVADDGTISYNGASINNLNIEGQSLLGNRYNQATRNLPVEAIAQVQVMENDQPIRALKDRVPSQKATLNIRLKAGYKAKSFGEAVTGGGMGDEALWNAKATIINIGRQNQMLVTLQTNNTGDNLKENTLEHIDLTDISSYEPLPLEWTPMQMGSYLLLSQQRSTFNQSVSVGLNQLHKLGTYGNLRTNISAYWDQQHTSDSTFWAYGGATSASLFENNRKRWSTFSVVPELHYELNAARTYLCDDLTASINVQKLHSSLLSNNALLQVEQRHTPFQLQNKFRATTHVGNNILQASSLTRYFRRNEKYVTEDFSETILPSSLIQTMATENFLTKNELATSFPIHRHELSVKYGFLYKMEDIGMEQEAVRNHHLRNHVEASMVLKYSKGYVNASVKGTWLYARLPWSVSAKSTNRLYASPSLSWNHKFSPKWSVRMTGAASEDASDETPFQSNYQSNYRTFVQPLDAIGWQHRKSAGASLSYADMIHMVAWNLMGSIVWIKADHTFTYSYTKRQTLVVPVWKDTHSRRLVLASNFDKTWSRPRLSLKANVSYNRSVQPILQNAREQTVCSNVCSSTLELRWNKLSWLQASAVETFNVAWQDNYENMESTTLKSLLGSFFLYVSPLKNMRISIKWEHSLMETESGKYDTNTFLDLLTDVSVSKRVSLSFSATNLLNNHQYTQAAYDGLNYHYFCQPLRKREILTKLTFKF